MSDDKNKISPELLSILVCPKCKGRLKANKNSLKCKKCRKSYVIKDGVPYMLIK
jgi:uncharacterized protein YbaR (Trm112 family)